MKNDVFSNTDLIEQREKLNKEILRRGSYRWWDPLATPRVGQDRSTPVSLPAHGERIGVDDHTYTIEENSSMSIEPARNVMFPAHGKFPAGEETKVTSPSPSTSAAQINVDEMRNFLVGLAKIQDINLFYGRDEVQYLALRDPTGIYDAIKAASKSELNRPLHQSPIGATKNDPNGGFLDRKHHEWGVEYPTTYPIEDGKFVMPSGELEGEEGPLSEENFFDDYGAKEGDGDFHPYNPALTPSPNRDWDDQGHDRDQIPTRVPVGGTPSSSFGPNPRNPVQGSSYPSRPVYGGVPGSCNVACTGLCYMTCDNQCSESCTTTCWGRCGDACTSSCGNQCTGCSSSCYSSCKTKCENDTGYACLKAGAKTVSIYSTGGQGGVPAQNHLDVTYHTCDGCSYTCQFYPNKRTTCWDAACMGNCYITCSNACSTSCFGGCIANEGEEGDNYRLGHGTGCSAGCTVNCVGRCEGVCVGYCVHTCWHSCKDTCADNCSWECVTSCGNGCDTGCKNGCKDQCTGNTDATSCKGGCEASCMQGCNKNCVGIGCRSICGVDSAGACEFNCRINCMAASCTAMCSDACVDMCTTCVNTCGWQCGACGTKCSSGCDQECNITCSSDCEHSCTTNCVNSCSEDCGGCSNLCYSCVGLCIGECSFKCEATCTNCTNNCSWWCDTSCSRGCFNNCSDRCISTCSGSCATFLMSETTNTVGPERPPTAEGYIFPNPANRWEERESFKLTSDVLPYAPKKKEYDILMTFDEDRNLIISGPLCLDYVLYQTSINGGVFNIDKSTGIITVHEEMLTPEISTNHGNLDGSNGILIALVDVKGGPDAVKEIKYELPIGFSGWHYGTTKNGKMMLVVERDIFMFPEVKDSGENL